MERFLKIISVNSPRYTYFEKYSKAIMNNMNSCCLVRIDNGMRAVTEIEGKNSQCQSFGERSGIAELDKWYYYPTKVYLFYSIVLQSWILSEYYG